MSNQSQTVIITGASSGIGAEIAKRYAKEGYSLLLLGRNESRLKKVQSECTTAKTEILAFDLTDIQQQHEALKHQLSKLPNPNVLINNAGIFYQASFTETSPSIWLEQFQVNLFSAVALTQFLWPYFLKNKNSSVLNISSTLGVKPTAHTSAYSAAKAAMINWTLSLAQEGGAYGIRANCICPGIIDTPIHQFSAAQNREEQFQQMTQYQLLSQVGQPQQIAEAAYFLGSNLSAWTTGSVLHVDGGINIK